MGEGDPTPIPSGGRNGCPGSCLCDTRSRETSPGMERQSFLHLFHGEEASTREKSSMFCPYP